MIFPKGAIKYRNDILGGSSESVRNVIGSSPELDVVGAVEQILFSFPLNCRTIYKGISQLCSGELESELPVAYLWGRGGGLKVGDGSKNCGDLEGALDELELYISNFCINKDVLIPLSGGLDSRFILHCVNLDKDPLKSGFTYHSGLSSELYIAKKLAKSYGLSHESIGLNSDIYSDVSLFEDHLGMVQLYHAALISIVKRNGRVGALPRLFLHGFMGDPIFGSKAAIRKSGCSMEEECVRYLDNALLRYPFFSRNVSAQLKDSILHDLYLDAMFYGVGESNATLEEVLFLTRRQQMIYKILALASRYAVPCVPFATNLNVMASALSLPQKDRVGRSQFVRYLDKKVRLKSRFNSEDPFGWGNVAGKYLRGACNYAQYLSELIWPTAKISPFQHEQLRAVFWDNRSFMQKKIEALEARIGFPLDWKSSMSRRFNSTDFGYSCATIGCAFL